MDLLTYESRLFLSLSFDIKTIQNFNCEALFNTLSLKI